jgi:hypothetical protein
MRRFALIFLIFLSLQTEAQKNLDRVTIKLWAIDSENNIDSVFFGYDKNATNDIDTVLGEKNIINQPFDELIELRSIQRKYEDQMCNEGGYSFNSEFNFDSKINFRSILYPPNLFEFIVKGKNYPIKIYADFKEMFDSTYYNGWSQIFLFDSLCNSPIVIRANDSDTLLFSVENERQYLIKIDLEYVHDGIYKLVDKSYDYKVFSTLVTGKLFVESRNNNENTSIEIYNSIGEKVLTDKFFDNTIIDLKDLTKGIYFVNVQSDDQKHRGVYKILKD